jgi:hypothetical protein
MRITDSELSKEIEITEKEVVQVSWELRELRIKLRKLKNRRYGRLYRQKHKLQLYAYARNRYRNDPEYRDKYLAKQRETYKKKKNESIIQQG